ncbi:MAG TPA: DUF188 domain-containing protein [Magnetospirillaceae bacterium]|nr:DUF188 domain-containing protein [Magnetospirillaceae bacterium]
MPSGPRGGERLTIWADADSLPRAVREILGRRAAAHRAAQSPGKPGGKAVEVRVVLVANRSILAPPGTELMIVEGSGAEAVDDRIVAMAVSGDLVVTRDIPLAARLAGAGLAVLNDRGTEWTEDTALERQSLRDFMAGLRSAGLAEMSRSRSWGPRERKAFADALDRVMRRLLTGP